MTDEDYHFYYPVTVARNLMKPGSENSVDTSAEDMKMTAVEEIRVSSWQ